MNITGQFQVETYPPNNGTGALYKNTTNNTNLRIDPSTNYDNIGMFTMYLDASRSWTGETSAVGGGASHTHGIKMTDGKYLKTGGGTGGSNTSTVSVKGAVQGHTLTINEIPSHTHTFTGTQVTTSENGAHTHKNQYDNQKSYGGGNNFGGLNINSNAWGNETNSAGSHTHTVTAKGTNSNTGGGASHTHGISIFR